MRIAHRIGIAVVAAALASVPGDGHAGVPPKRAIDPRVDEKLLEFLGSVDPAADAARPDDGGWLKFLSQVDIGRIARPARAAPARPKPVSPAAGAGKPGG